jgi:Fe2+ transport system protein FeoA
MYSLPVAERIGTMLREYNNPIVADAAELRLVVTNKLLDLASCGDPKIEIKATEMLGKISDVGLFSEKTEITVTYNNVSDIDTAIKDKIRKMLMAQGVTDIAPIDIDLDKEFGDPLEIEMVEEVVVEPEKEEPDAL